MSQLLAPFIRWAGPANRQEFIVATALPIIAIGGLSLAIGAQRWPSGLAVQPLSESIQGIWWTWPLTGLWVLALIINCACFVRRSRSINKSIHWVWPYAALWILSLESLTFVLIASGWSWAWASVYVPGDRNFSLGQD